MKVSVDAAARQEWLDAVAYYAETMGSRSALRFVRAVQHTIECIAEAPRSFPVIGPSKRLRRARVLRYPHSVVYVVASDEVRIVAVAHGRRRPEYWAGRAR